MFIFVCWFILWLYLVMAWLHTDREVVVTLLSHTIESCRSIVLAGFIIIATKYLSLANHKDDKIKLSRFRIKPMIICK